MANENTAKENTSKEPVDSIGTLTYPRAVENFGKEKALAVLHEVARIGGHGQFTDADFLNPLFGGLQMPDPTKIPEPKKEEFAHLPEAEFHFAAAKEQHEELKKRAVANRGEINKYYKSIK
jgi:hypothetical protein